MYSSVKFFDPIVRLTFPFAGLEVIRLSVLPDSLVADVLLPPPPHAAIVTARTAATDSTNAARIRRPLITPDSFPAWTVRPTGPIAGILCGASGPLQLQALRGKEALHAGQRYLDQRGEQRDHDRARHHAVVAVDAGVDDEVPEGGQANDRGDVPRREDVDPRVANPRHDRGRREGQLHLQDHLPRSH